MSDFPTQWPVLVFIGMMVSFMVILLFCSITDQFQD